MNNIFNLNFGIVIVPVLSKITLSINDKSAKGVLLIYL